MPLHVFEDDELDILIEAVNAMQLCFHPRYAPDCHFLVHDLFELSNNIDDVLILADKNIISPICEIAITGSHKSKAQLVLVSQRPILQASRTLQAKQNVKSFF